MSLTTPTSSTSAIDTSREANQTKKPKPSLISTHLYLIGMAALWGASWPAGQVVVKMQHVPPFHAAQWRFSVASIALLLWLGITQRGLPSISKKQALGIMIGGIIGIFGYAFCFMAGLQTIPAGRASLIVAFNPVITALLAAWLFKEPLNKTILAGMAFAVLGSLTVISHGQPSQIFTGGLGTGELYLLGCVLTWSTYSVLGKKMMQGISPLTAITYTSCVGCIGLSLAAYCLEPSSFPWDYGLELQSMVLFLGLGATVLAYVWYFQGIATVGAGAAASYTSLVPVFGVISAILYLGEPVDDSLIVGGILTIIGVLIMNHARNNLAATAG